MHAHIHTHIHTHRVTHTRLRMHTYFPDYSKHVRDDVTTITIAESNPDFRLLRVTQQTFCIRPRRSGRQHQGMDRPGVCQVPEGGGEQGNMVETGCKIICGAPTTLTVKG